MMVIYIYLNTDKNPDNYCIVELYLKSQTQKWLDYWMNQHQNDFEQQLESYIFHQDWLQTMNHLPDMYKDHQPLEDIAVCESM